jgi:hypothetical protein
MACQTFVNGDISVSWIPLAERVKAAPLPATSPGEAGGA